MCAAGSVVVQACKWRTLQASFAAGWTDMGQSLCAISRPEALGRYIATRQPRQTSVSAVDCANRLYSTVHIQWQCCEEIEELIIHFLRYACMPRNTFGFQCPHHLVTYAPWGRPLSNRMALPSRQPLNVMYVEIPCGVGRASNCQCNAV